MGGGRDEAGVRGGLEPDHGRPDLLSHTFPVVAFQEVLKDVARISQFVEAGKVPVAYAVFVDEGTSVRRREVALGSSWVDWPTTTPES
jgi:hypothetical protein